MRHWIVAAAAAALLWPASAGAASPTAKEMAGSVAQALKASGELKDFRVGVKFEDGVAWLVGSVTSERQSAAAERLASEVPGVAHVVNKLEVKPNGEPLARGPKMEKETDSDLLLTMLEKPESAPAPLPPNPTALPAAGVEAPAKLPTAQPARLASRGMPRPIARTAANNVRPAQYGGAYAGGVPQGQSTAGATGVSYDSASMPGYAWPSYAAHPNYAAVTYPKQYSPAAWPYIGPFHPYPQVPLGWRKVTLEWDDGWWFLDFSHQQD